MTLNNQTVKNDEKCRNFQASDIAHPQKDKWISCPSQVFIVFHRLMFYLFFPHSLKNTSLLQRYIHGAFEDMRHWYIQHFMSYKHEMNEHTG